MFYFGKGCQNWERMPKEADTVDYLGYQEGRIRNENCKYESYLGYPGDGAS